MKYLWLDLETSGLDINTDQILEIGAVLCDEQMQPVAEFEEVSHPIPRNFADYWDAQVVDMHTKSGLLDVCKEATATEWEMVQRLIEWLDGNGCESGQVRLCGSGIGHFDLPLLMAREYWTDDLLGGFFHYRILDISSVREFLLLAGVEIEPQWDPKPKAHRALPDALDHLAEYRRMVSAMRFARVPF